MTFAAPNPICNATLSEGHMLVNLLASNGISGATLFVNPVQGVPGEVLGQMIPESEFTKVGVPATGPIYLQVQVPGKEDFFTVGLVLYFVVVLGVPVKQALV